MPSAWSFPKASYNISPSSPDLEINEWYACDYITCKQSDKFIEKLNKKKATAGEMKNSMTESEMICRIIDNSISNLNQEIHDIKVKQKQGH